MKQDDEDVLQVERQIILPPRLSPIKRNSVEEVKNVGVSTVTATQGASTADTPTSIPLSAETQTRNRDLEPKGRNMTATFGKIPKNEIVVHILSRICPLKPECKQYANTLALFFYILLHKAKEIKCLHTG